MIRGKRENCSAQGSNSLETRVSPTPRSDKGALNFKELFSFTRLFSLGSFVLCGDPGLLCSSRNNAKTRRRPLARGEFFSIFTYYQDQLIEKGIR
jgi:hypothetical protein